MITKRLLIIGLLLLPSIVSAQETGGSVQATIDGVPARWQVSGTLPSRKNHWTGTADLANVKISTLAVSPKNPPTTGPLTIAFYIEDLNGAHRISEVDIVYSDPTKIGAYVTARHGSGSIITLQEWKLEGTKLRLRAGFDVSLQFTDDFGVTLHTQDTKTLSGQFDITFETNP